MMSHRVYFWMVILAAVFPLRVFAEDLPIDTSTLSGVGVEWSTCGDYVTKKTTLSSTTLLLDFPFEQDVSTYEVCDAFTSDDKPIYTNYISGDDNTVLIECFVIDRVCHRRLGFGSDSHVYWKEEN